MVREASKVSMPLSTLHLVKGGNCIKINELASNFFVRKCFLQSFWCHFHQHFMRTFYANILAPKITKLCFGFEFFLRQNIGAKCVCKMLMKLTPALSFWVGNILLKRNC